MPRQTADQPIKTKTQRAKLEVRRKPYYRRLSDSLSIGYRRLPTPPGTWVVRERKQDGSYSETKLRGVSPDDVVDNNGKDILTFDQACDLARGTLAKGDDEVTLAQASEDWATGKKAATDNTTRAKNYDYTARRISIGFPAGQTINHLTMKQIEAWRDAHLVGHVDLRKRRSTANRELATLKAILNAAVTRYAMEIRPVWAKVAKFNKAESFGKRVIVLDAAQKEALTGACTSEALRNLITAGLLTGCRYGELIGALVRDLSGRRLTVTGKTGERTLILSVDAAAFFASLVRGVNNQDRAILLKDNGAQWGDGDQIDPFGRAAKAARLETGTTFYACRHTYITAHLTAGVPVTALAHQCGTSAEMIERTYANFLGDDLERWFDL